MTNAPEAMICAAIDNAEDVRDPLFDDARPQLLWYAARRGFPWSYSCFQLRGVRSRVQMIVNVIEPEHGVLLDPACGSGGMFVQTSHFIERAGLETMKRVTFYGHEKNETTARLAQMNLAVHGLEGKIRSGNEAITCYHDPHELAGKCDFVMANPPFNVDEVDADKVKGDVRLPFDLPGVNKAKRVTTASSNPG